MKLEEIPSRCLGAVGLPRPTHILFTVTSTFKHQILISSSESVNVCTYFEEFHSRRSLRYCVHKAT